MCHYAHTFSLKSKNEGQLQENKCNKTPFTDNDMEQIHIVWGLRHYPKYQELIEGKLAYETVSTAPLSV